MKNPFVSFLILFVLVNCAFAQVPHSSFGVLTQEDINYKQFPDDPEAEAVVLYDKGESFFYKTEDGGYDIRFTRTRRIKILKEAGFRYGKVEIPFYQVGVNRNEFVKEIEAHTFNFENGRIIKNSLEKDDIFVKQINNSWSSKTFAFPELKVGSVIEYRYVLETPFHFNLPDWKFQDRIPTLYSQYVLKLIPFYEYNMLTTRISKFDEQSSVEERGISRHYRSIEFHDMVHSYVMKNVPAFKDESYITSAEDYIMKVDFQLSKFYNPQGGSTDIITSWPKLSKELLNHEDFGGFINKSRRIFKKIEEELGLEGLSELEKSKRIIAYVKEGYNWNNCYGKYTTQNTGNFFKSKSGSVSEINLFLLGLLEGAEIDVKPVILSTRGHGKIFQQYPFASFFNYVVVLVENEGKRFFVDGTDPHTQFDQLPIRCLNDYGLVLDKDEPSWANLRLESISLNNKSFTMFLDTERAMANVQVSIQSTDYESYGLRNKYSDNESSLKDYFMKYGIENPQGLKTVNFDKKKRPYIIGVSGETQIEIIDGNLIVSPFLAFPISENTLTEPTRDYPVDFVYPFKDSFTANIEIPKGYKVAELPSDFRLNHDLIEAELTFDTNGESVIVIGFYQFKKAVYQSNEYNRVKAGLDLIIDKFNKQIVFEPLEPTE